MHNSFSDFLRNRNQPLSIEEQCVINILKETNRSHAIENLTAIKNEAPSEQEVSRFLNTFIQEVRKTGLMKEIITTANNIPND